MNTIDLGSGTAVILLHGFPLDSQNWKMQINTLAKKCRVIVPDIIPRTTMKQMADDINSLLQQLSIEKAVFCGFSLGGYILLEILEQHPEKVLGASFISTRANDDSEEKKEERNSLILKIQTEGMNINGYLEAIFSERYAKNVQSDVELIRNIISSKTPKDLIDWITAIRDRSNHLGKLAQHKIPSAVLGSRSDQTIPLTDLLDLHDALTDSSIEIIDSAGHMVPFECPDQVNSHIRQLIKRVEFRP